MPEPHTESGESPATPAAEPSLEARRLQVAIEGRLFGATTPPVRIGRFVIADMIARGGMGTVYRAYDARLDRRVAVKVLNERRDTAAARLDREARALAKLNHPNVVTIHEVGDDAAGVFVAMEYVDGGTLADWCAPEVPRTRERLARIMSFAEQAAQGLIAAHALGLVHRDLKPANMLIGTDDRLRIADFGLVASGGDPMLQTDPGAPDLDVDTPLTASGTVVGTPAFMAPEQLDGHADARSDQFSYCASFFLAFHGVRPYAGTSLAALRQSLASGRLETPTRSAVPRDIHAVLVRGLSVRPEDRFADMAALLAALRAGRARHRWVRGGVIAAGVVVVSGLAALGSGADALDPCIDGPTRFGATWNDDRRAAVRTSIAAVDVGFAATTAAKVDALLDTYASEWIAGYRDACEATLVERTESRALMTARVRCLERRQRDFAAVVGVLERADATIVEHAARSVAQLPRVPSCADANYVLAESPRPDDPDIAAQVEATDDELSRVAAEIAAGKYDDAGTRAQAAVEQAERIGFGPLLLRALNGLGRAEQALGRSDAALVAARRGFTLAELDDQPAATANHLVLGEILHARSAHAESLSHHQRALTLRLRTAARDDPDVASIHSAIGAVLHSMGEYDRSIEHLNTAVATLTTTLGTGHVATALAHSRLGTTRNAQGEYEEGLAHHELALAAATAALGADHPEIANYHKHSGWTLREQGKLAEALEHQQRALEIRRAALGDGNVTLGEFHVDLAETLAELGKYDEAIAHQRDAIAIASGTDGADPHTIAAAYSGLGVLHARKGEVGPALEHLRHALGLWERLVGENHASVAQVLLDLGYTLQAQGDLAGGLAHHERALAIAIRVFDPDHPMVGDIHAGLGSAMLAAGRFDEALTHHRRAHAIDQKKLPAGHATLAADRNAIGGCLRLLGRYDEALVEHREALAMQLAGLGEGHPYTGTSYLGIGYTLAAMGEDAEALDAFRSTAAIFAKAHGEGHRGVVIGTAGAVLAASVLGRTDEAQTELVRLRAAVAASGAPGTAEALALAEAIATRPRSRRSEDAARAAALALERQGDFGFRPVVARWLGPAAGRRTTSGDRGAATPREQPQQQQTQTRGR